MPVYRLEIERGDTLWVTANDDRGALEMTSAHIAAEAIDAGTPVQLTHDADETLILRAPAAEWCVAAQGLSC